MPAGLFSKRVNDSVGLSPDDRKLLQGLRVTERTLEHREPLSREGDIATQCAIVHAGFLAATRSFPIGNRCWPFIFQAISPTCRTST